MLPDMRRLKINRLDLEAAFESGFSETHHYLDTQTGEVLMVGDDYRRELEDLMAGGWPGGQTGRRAARCRAA